MDTSCSRGAGRVAIKIRRGGACQARCRRLEETGEESRRRKQEKRAEEGENRGEEDDEKEDFTNSATVAASCLCWECLTKVVYDIEWEGKTRIPVSTKLSNESCNIELLWRQVRN